MSCFQSDRCTKDELAKFKKEVLAWFESKGFDLSNFRIRAFTCYNGDVRFYSGEKMESANQKSSFRREESNKNENGDVIGYHGTRGIHTTTIPIYIAINRDEWEETKKAYELPKEDERRWYSEDLIFNKIPLK